MSGTCLEHHYSSLNDSSGLRFHRKLSCIPSSVAETGIRELWGLIHGHSGAEMYHSQKHQLTEGHPERASRQRPCSSDFSQGLQGYLVLWDSRPRGLPLEVVICESRAGPRNLYFLTTMPSSVPHVCDGLGLQLNAAGSIRCQGCCSAHTP